MRCYIRNYVPGGTFFFTVVTYERRRMLTDALARPVFRSALRQVRAKWPFDIIAIVLLPDHVHTVWSLPADECDYSLRLQKVKEIFTKQYLAAGGTAAIPTPSEAFHGQRGIWQPRFWEHTVAGEDDLKRCVDYVHWNPVKHGFVRRVKDYAWSSFHRYVSAGEYAGDWGAEDPCPGLEMPE